MTTRDATGRRSLEIKLLRPDGSREVLLWVKEFRQDWQTPYVFKQPVACPPVRRCSQCDVPTSMRAPTAAATHRSVLRSNHYAPSEDEISVTMA